MIKAGFAAAATAKAQRPNKSENVDNMRLEEFYLA
jgi:hypothetical protein